jgi:ABC-type Fe3+ transport system permease subunit
MNYCSLAAVSTLRFAATALVAAIGTTWIAYYTLKTETVGMGRGQPRTERSKDPKIYWIIFGFWAALCVWCWIIVLYAVYTAFAAR